MKKVYNYNEEGYFIGESQAKVSPLDNLYLLPAKATFTPPPTTNNEEVARFVDGTWQKVVNKIGQTYYLPNDPNMYTITALGEDKPQDAQDDKDIELYIREKKDEANSIRERLLREDITYRDNPFQCDDASVRNMTTKLLGINNGDIFYWRDSNNNDHSFSDGDLESMLNMISTRGSLVYQASWLVKADIEASPNPQDIDVEALYGVHYNA